MRKKMKSVLALLLAFSMVLTSFPATAFAATESKATNSLEVGKTYSVPVTRLDRFGLPIDWSIQDKALMEYGKDAVAHNALVTPKADGTYDVTLEWAMYSILDAVQFFKQDVITATDAGKAMETVKATAMGTFNIPERFYTDFSKASSTRYKSFDFTDLMHTLFSAEENAKYYDNVNVQNNDTKNISYVTLNLASVENNVYFKVLESWKYGQYTPTEYYKKNTPENREAILTRCRECVTNGGYSFDITKAVPVVGLDAYDKDTTNVVVERAAETLSLDRLVESKDETIAKVEGLFNGQPEITKNSDGTLALTYTLADPSKVTGVSVATGRTAYVENTNIPLHQGNAMDHFTRAYRAMEYAPVEVKDGKFTVTFKNGEEANWGHIIKITNAEGKKEDFSDVAVDTNYLFTLKLNYGGVMFTSNEWSFATSKTNVNPSAVFEANKLTEGEDYVNIQKKLNGYSAKNIIWNVSLKEAGKAVNPKNAVNAEIVIPEGWNTGKIQLYYLNGAAKDGALVNVKDCKVNGNKVSFATKDLNRTYVLSQDSVEADIKNLEDGLYKVDVTSWNVTQVNEVSMSNAALRRGASFIEVKDGNYTLYVGLQGITIGKDDGYAQKLFYTDDNAKKQEAEYLGWMTNEKGDSVYNIDYYGENFGIYYPSAVKFPLAKANIIRNNHEIDFWVPIMDEISGAVPGSGDAHRVAKFKFYNLEKLNADAVAPSYEKTYLLKALEDAEKYTKLEDPSIYEETSFNTLKEKAEAGRTVYNGTPDGALIKKTADEIYTALKALKAVDVDKTPLEKKLAEAKEASKKDGYTDESVKALNNAIAEAQKVYDDSKSTPKQIKTAVENLDKAIKALAKKPEVKPDDKLDYKNLKDGVYIINGDMIKINKTDKSMADAAINHNIKLTVKDGKYYITLDFKGLKYAGRHGYLGNLKYFLEGYTSDQYGRPMGDLKDAVVESLQLDAKGNVIKDDLGTNYPDLVTFELIPEALEDGFVPLQVFVPVMDSITAGLGTQEVFLKLDWATIDTATADDDRFTEDEDVVNPENKPEAEGETPKTGDAADMLPWMVLALAAGTAVVALRKKED